MRAGTSEGEDEEEEEEEELVSVSVMLDDEDEVRECSELAIFMTIDTTDSHIRRPNRRAFADPQTQPFSIVIAFSPYMHALACNR